MPNKGLFITLEGCEGVGKSTQAAMLKRHFEQQGLPALFTREPGGTDVSEQIRKIILNPANDMDAVTELLLYSAARREHVKKVILPALDNGMIVVCDRFVDSTAAYQGYGRGVDLNLINMLSGESSANINVDLTIFLDLPPKDGFLRKGGCDKSDRLDSEDISFHLRVYEGFRQIAKTNSRVVSIDAARGKDEVFKDVLRAINERYRHKRINL